MQRVAIHSVPRSGSTWLGELFNSHPKVNYSYQPLFSYAFKDYLNEESSFEHIQDYFQKIQQSEDEFIRQKEARLKGKLPQFSKNEKSTHSVYKEVRYHHILENLLEQDADIKVIGLVRNPMAVINSWLRAPKEFRADLGWKIVEEWRFAPKKNQNKKEEFNGYEKWKEVYFLFKDLEKKYPNRFYFLPYLKLLSDTEKTIQSLFDFSNLDMSQQTIDFINKPKSKQKTGTYTVNIEKQKDDFWKTELPKFIQDDILKDLHTEKITEYLLN